MTSIQKTNLIHKICFTVLRKRLEQMKVYRAKLKAMSDDQLIAELKRLGFIK